MKTYKIIATWTANDSIFTKFQVIENGTVRTDTVGVSILDNVDFFTKLAYNTENNGGYIVFSLVLLAYLFIGVNLGKRRT